MNEINVAKLAYIGDSVYEIYVRKYLLEKTGLKVNKLVNEAKKFVSAKSQEKILDCLIKRQIFTEDEMYTIKRARNYTPKSKPQYVSVLTYKKATALEALFGILYLNNNKTRLDEIFNEIVGDK